MFMALHATTHLRAGGLFEVYSCVRTITSLPNWSPSPPLARLVGEAAGLTGGTCDGDKVPMPMLDLNLGLKGSQCVFRIRPARKPDMWVYIIDRGDGSIAKAGEVGSRGGTGPEGGTARGGREIAAAGLAGRGGLRHHTLRARNKTLSAQITVSRLIALATKSPSQP